MAKILHTSSAAYVLLTCLDRHEDGKGKQPSAYLLGTSDNLSGDLRRLVTAGFLTKHALGLRHSEYELTPIGIEHALEVRRFRATDRNRANAAWNEENVVYGLPRADGAPSLTEKQASAWVRGYWEAQMAQGTPPADAPPEVCAVFARESVMWAQRMIPRSPFAPTKTS